MAGSGDRGPLLKTEERRSAEAKRLGWGGIGRRAPAGLGHRSLALSGPAGCSRPTGVARGVLSALAAAPRLNQHAQSLHCWPALASPVLPIPDGCTARDCASLGRGRNVPGTLSTT